MVSIISILQIDALLISLNIKWNDSGQSGFNCIRGPMRDIISG